MRITSSRMGSTLLPCVLFLITAPAAHASILVLSNLNQANGGQDSSAYVGQAIVSGPAVSSFYGAALLVNYTPVAPRLEVEAMNANGTVGSTLYTTTTFSYSAGQLTFIAPTSFILAPNTGYFLVLSDLNTPVSWDFTNSANYTASMGFSIPANNATFQSGMDNTVSGRRAGYETLANGPDIFSLSTAAAPEPATWFYMLPLAFAALYCGRKRAGAWRRISSTI